MSISFDERWHILFKIKAIRSLHLFWAMVMSLLKHTGLCFISRRQIHKHPLHFVGIKQGKFREIFTSIKEWTPQILRLQRFAYHKKVGHSMVDCGILKKTKSESANILAHTWEQPKGKLQSVICKALQSVCNPKRFAIFISQVYVSLIGDELTTTPIPKLRDTAASHSLILASELSTFLPALNTKSLLNGNKETYIKKHDHIKPQA